MLGFKKSKYFERIVQDLSTMRNLTNLDLDALRSFVVGIELENFSLAASQLCRSPAAVSAHLRKLEEQTQCALVQKQGRNLVLTKHGEILFTSAKSLLELNDKILNQLQQHQVDGEIYFGLQEDFGDSLLQHVISQFIQQFPNVKLHTQVDRNFNLIQKVEKNTLDFALIWQQSSLQNQFQQLHSVATFWIKNSNFQLNQILEQKASIPLIVLSQPCTLRQVAIDMLNQQQIPWHIAYECNSLSALWSAVRAGIGISIRSDFAIPKDLEKIQGNILPSLPNFNFGLYNTSAELKQIDQYFIKCLSDCLKL